MYKLDGGLDHLLLDEVQDTAPAQWRIAHALSAEFFAGEAARETDRTVFAVGDRKQSIYSFQGADIEEFDRSHKLLAARVQAADKPWREAQLDVSFRSTRPVLELVDRVFANPTAAAGVVEPGQTLTHYADRAEPCRCGGALAARAGARRDRTDAVGGAGAEPGPDLGATAIWRRRWRVGSPARSAAA